jgi:hypothetical protein
VWQVNTDYVLVESAGEMRMLLLPLYEILKSIPQNDGQLRRFLYPLALRNVVGPHQVVHSKWTWRRILDSLSQRNYTISLRCTKCGRSKYMEVIVGLYNVWRMRHIARKVRAMKAISEQALNRQFGVQKNFTCP